MLSIRYSAGPRRTAVAVVLAVLLAAQSPMVAFASTKKEDLQQQVASAEDRIMELNSEAEICEYELQNTTAELNDTKKSIKKLNKQIPKTRKKLEAAQDDLSAVMSESYKNGVPTLLDVFLGAKSFDDLVSRITYANKVAEHERNAVVKVQDLTNKLEQEKNDLETEKQNKERLIVEETERRDAAQAALASAEEYYDDLSDELRKEIEREQAEAQKAAKKAAAEAAAEAKRVAQEAAAAEAEAARQAEAEAQAAAEAEAEAEAEAQAAQQQESQSSGQQSEADQESQDEQSQSTAETSDDEEQGQSQGSESSEEQQPEPEQEPEPEPEPEPEQEPEQEPVQEQEQEQESEPEQEETASSQPSGSAANMVARAYSIIGAAHQMSGYNWTGSVSSSAFTCSGVIDYAMGNPSHSSSPESLCAAVGTLKDTSQLNYGDLVFYSYAGRYPGHVGIYVGGGQIIDSIPNGGVQVRDVNYMPCMGGGPIC